MNRMESLARSLALVIAVSLVMWIVCATLAYAKSVHHYMVTRHAADHYVTAEGIDIYTLGCTTTARLMDATVIWDGPQSRIYFLDKDGEVEDECPVKTR